MNVMKELELLEPAQVFWLGLHILVCWEELYIFLYD